MKLATADDSIYNILAIDGGGIRGIITVTCVSRMEEFAYKYAQSQGYTDKPTFPKYLDSDGNLIKRMHMLDLFDMFAGTSTGSIASSGLCIREDPKNATSNPRFWASGVLDIYVNGRPLIFQKDSHWFTRILSYTLYFICFAGLFFLMGRCLYNNPKKMKYY